jgi:glutamate dehydrogenase
LSIFLPGESFHTFAEVTKPKPGQVDIASISVALKLLRTLVRP